MSDPHIQLEDLATAFADRFTDLIEGSDKYDAKSTRRGKERFRVPSGIIEPLSNNLTTFIRLVLQQWLGSHKDIELAQSLMSINEELEEFIRSANSLEGGLIQENGLPMID